MPASKSASPYYSSKTIIAIILLVLGLVIGLLLLSRPQLLKPRAATANAVLSLTPDKTSLKQGETVTITIGLNPSSQPVVGVDAIVNFNTSAFTLSDVQVNTASGFKTFVPLVSNSNSFDKTTVVNNANSSGTVKFGAATFDMATQTVDTAVSTTSSNVAKLVFVAKAAAPTGTSSISFQYTAARNTTDTNVVIANTGTTTAPEDILAQPSALSLTITASTTPKAGDANGDNVVDLLDYNIWLGNYKKTVTGGATYGNFNYPTDMIVDLLDYNIWLANYKK